MQNIFTKVFGSITKALNIPFVQTVSSRYVTGFGTSLAKKSGLEEYKNWVNACVKARSNALANIKLHLMNGDEEVLKSPVLDVLNKVNSHMTKKDLLRATQSFLDLNGNAFWFLAREERSAEIKEIHILRPDKMSIILSQGEDPLAVEGYVYKQADGKNVPLNANEVIHFKTFNPLGNYPFPHRGMGIVEAAQWAIETDNEIRAYNLNFFKNGARPDGVLEVTGEGSLAPEEYKRLSSQWEQEHKGTANSHKTAVLSGGLSWKQISVSQSELEFASQKEMNRDEILALFNVPKTVIGLTEDVNRASAEAALYMFNSLVVDELMQNMVDTLNEFFLPEFEQEGLMFTYDTPIQADRQMTINEYTAAINKWMTRNEIRAKEGLPPTEEGDMFLDSAMLVPVDTVAAVKITERPQLKEAKKKITLESIDLKSKLDDFLKSKNIETKDTKGFKHLTVEQKTAYGVEWKTSLARGRAPFQKKLVAFFKKQEKEVLANLKNEIKGLAPEFYVHKSANDVLFDMDQAIKTSISLITPFIQEYINASGKNAAKVTGTTFDPNDPSVQAFVKARAQLFADEINETTGTKVLDTVKASLADGESGDDIAQKIADIYDEATGYRSDMIARTEISASYNEGAKIAYQQAGVEQWEWMVVDPEDEDCKGNEGEVVKIGDPFKDGSIQPPDPHPNCECATIPVFND